MVWKRDTPTRVFFYCLHYSREIIWESMGEKYALRRNLSGRKGSLPCAPDSLYLHLIIYITQVTGHKVEVLLYTSPRGNVLFVASNISQDKRKGILN